MNKKPILIFGASSFASLAAYSVVQDAGSTVLAHVVDDEFVTTEHVDTLPLIGLSQVRALYPPERCDVLVPLGYTRINALRKERCEQLKAMGYRLHSFVSSHATVWAGCEIRENTLIFENSIIQPYATLGRNVIVRAGANIGHHSRIGDHCFIASGVVTGGNVTIDEQCFIGLGAILRDGLHIAERCFIGAGAVIVKNTEPDGVYVGNPARRLEKSSLEVTGGA
jgi:sugar O-acyltransferase (sialic acid O-acetyltransferase NeuD family)